jgi:hypothetical protein
MLTRRFYNHLRTSLKYFFKCNLLLFTDCLSLTTQIISLKTKHFAVTSKRGKKLSKQYFLKKQCGSLFGSYSIMCHFCGRRLFISRHPFSVFLSIPIFLGGGSGRGPHLPFWQKGSCIFFSI